MNSPDVIVDALKGMLKLRGHTYASLAKEIKLSESSVKRLFAERSFTLRRVLQICDVLQVDLGDLAKLNVTREAQLPNILSLDQETELAASPKLFAVFYLTSKLWPAADIAERLNLTRAEVEKLLLRLDKIGVIELHANNRYKLLFSKDFRLQPGGPMQQFYRERIRADFLRLDAGEVSDEAFLIGEVSKATWDVVQKRVENLLNEIRTLLSSDAALPKSQTKSIGLFFLAKPWIYAPLFGKSRS